MDIFVGNLSFETNEKDLIKVFEVFGGVASVEIVKDKNGVKSRGFAFVEMTDDKGAYAAIAALDGRQFMGRAINVELARPKSARKIEQRKPRMGSAYKKGRRSLSFMKKHKVLRTNEEEKKETD